MVYGQNWVLFQDKPPISSIPGGSVVEYNFNVIIASKLDNNYSYSLMSAKDATDQYLSGSNFYAWKFIDPCKI